MKDPGKQGSFRYIKNSRRWAGRKRHYYKRYSYDCEGKRRCVIRLGERKLEYKDSKGQDCYFYYSNIAGTDLDMLGYVPVADIESEVTDWSIVLLVSGMKKRESKSETFSANPFEYEFLYAPLGDKGAYAYQQPWYGFSVNKDSEEKEIAVEFLRFMMQEKEIDGMASIKGLPSVAENGTDEWYAGLRDAKSIEASFINDGSVPDSIRAALEQACTAMQTRQCRRLWSCVQRNKIGKREERLICENKWVAFWCQRW